MTLVTVFTVAGEPPFIHPSHEGFFTQTALNAGLHQAPARDTEAALPPDQTRAGDRLQMKPLHPAPLQ